MFCLVSERVCDIHSSYHVKKNTSSSTSSSSKTLCLQRERERERARERANTKRDRQTEEEADVVSFLVPLERRRPFEIIIIVSELSERATSSFYLIPLRGPITLVFVICVQGIIEKKREREREREDDDDEKDFGRPENAEENRHKWASNEQSSGDFAAKPTER